MLRAHASRVAAIAAIAIPVALAVSARNTTPIASAAPVVATAGKSTSASTPFRLPWRAGTSLYLTQDANDDCCSDHIGSNKWAFDFAAWDGQGFDVLAPAAGTVAHVKMSSNHGCGDAACVNEANYIVIDHGDGTQTTMLHLEHGTLDPAVRCGSFVRRGQKLARAGSTGWSTGVHLHVERDQVKKTMKQVCECGADGMACAPSVAGWSQFWPSVQQPNVSMKFQEWSTADAPNNRRGNIGPSTNVDEHEDVLTLTLDGRFTPVTGTWDAKAGGAKGSYKSANADGKASARLSLKNSGAKMGTYEVWAYVPLGAAATDVTVTLETSKGTVTKGTLDAGSIGGAYHPVKGLERVAIDGSEEALLFSSDVAVEGKQVVADAVVLRRAGPLVVDPTLEVAKAQ